MAAQSENAEGEEVGLARRAGAHEAGVEGVYSGEVALSAKLPGSKAALVELHVCMGLNSCAAKCPNDPNDPEEPYPYGTRHDPDGTAPMAGMGSCATAIHVCHGDNACRGQGGCGYAGSAYEQAKPGNQACSTNGSCASPINVSRVFSAGPYKGKNVWKRARAIFEERMYEAGVKFGPSPGEGIPDDLVPGGWIQ
jgi:hypothetical protein